MLYSLQSSFKTLTVATSSYTASSIKSLTDGVADWQLKYFDTFDKWVPTFQQRTRDEETGWIKGAFYKGLADWAARTNNAEYFEFLKTCR